MSASATASTSSPPLPSPSCSEFSLSAEVAEALHAAAEAKASLLYWEDQVRSATAALDQLVETGVLPEKGLPLVDGYTIYRSEGRKTYAYPESIKALEADLKQRKKLAEQLGDATEKRGNPFWTIKPAEAATAA
ncbi:hypothetical protein KBZ18_10010 [Synechococcus sp. Cruz-9H2]|uniref:hypothetical protein n=1 Tax=unclassified Synechococcus TaxID=2626047 RepID=UPI0020CD011B|nr:MULTISPECIES: hypothetical protein [unclassified Synechococcus]MCP9819826.1 hypothetical protein [Synechococcus sp. Cruz-9H2]MCP9844108.1 hypothetical protein [Synechococcus sp. Edmonson 11F2]MCP9856256.1 hypothetical protein [Synechococcus sp. Cruz-9C9]MCP9863541.1 hypothetical protein [Synechococcus sp. Cruz-7E5]MCP9870737.1 hypothetical protein [Synechococcus sp. Cruz-7B9]